MYAVMDAEKVKELREEKGLSRRDLAAAAGISLSTDRLFNPATHGCRWLDGPGGG